MSTPHPTQTRPTGDRREELERIKAATWPEEGKQERIGRVVRAIDELKPPAYQLDAQTWKFIAQSPEVFD